MKKKVWFLILIITGIFFISGFFVYKMVFKKEVKILSYTTNGNKIVFTLDGPGKCLLSETLLDVKEFKDTDESNQCTYSFVTGPVNFYFRNVYGQELRSVYDLNFSRINSIDIINNDIYLAVGGTEKIEYEVDYIGEIEDKPILSVLDSSVAYIDDENVLHGTTVGKTKLVLKFDDFIDERDITVTDFIVTKPAEFDDSKPWLGCGLYSKEDNDFIDALLADRIEDVGYRTRAAVVEAARFLGLEFPYRINYFTENGRVDSYINNYADGEGRYYHTGLYLHESRFDNLNPDMIVAGPQTWGCLMNEYSWERVRANGLDCSGFVSWAILQAGFDCRDLGSGIAHDWPDLTDLGEKVWLPDALENDSLRVGDLLAGGDGGPSDGGHIAIVAGIDDDGYIYVAEELGYINQWGLWIKKYNKSELMDYFWWQVDMTEYYNAANGDGKLTNYWM